MSFEVARGKSWEFQAPKGAPEFSVTYEELSIVIDTPGKPLTQTGQQITDSHPGTAAAVQNKEVSHGTNFKKIP